MKRIFLLAMVFMLVLQVTAFAKVGKSATNDGAHINSEFEVIYLREKENTLYECMASIRVDRSYLTDIFNDDRSYFAVTAWVPSNKNMGENNGNEENGLIFSKKAPVTLEVYKNNKKSLVNFKKVYSVSNMSIMYKIKKSDLAPIYDADKVILLLPAKNSEMIEIEIPKEIIKEWQYILTVDMRKVKKEILEN